MAQNPGDKEIGEAGKHRTTETKRWSLEPANDRGGLVHAVMLLNERVPVYIFYGKITHIVVLRYFN